MFGYLVDLNVVVQQKYMDKNVKKKILKEECI